ncbi:MAG: helix-turn-helix domain containing protein [Bacilli bacterium]|nr:helix-turn-helix domain containing protein [Bacilli bacterium]
MNKNEVIINEAKKMFNDIGYKATTMEALANKIDIGKGTLYLYFKSKEELLKYIIDELVNTINNKAIDIEMMDVDLNKKIILFVDEIITLKKEQQLLAKLVVEAEESHNTIVKKYVDQIENNIIEKIKEKIDIAVSKKYIKACNSQFKAFLIYKVYLIMVLEWEEKYNSKITEEELFGLIKNMFN